MNRKPADILETPAPKRPRPGSKAGAPAFHSPWLSPWSDSIAPAYCRDPAGRLLDANVAFARKFGRALSMPARDSVIRLIHPDDLPGFRAVEAELQKPPHQATSTHRWLTPQGWRWMSWDENVVFDDEGSSLGVRAIGRDVTRQRLTEELYLKLSRAVEQSPVGIVITDAEGRVQYVNPKFSQVYGHSLEEILENNLQVLREGHASEDAYRRFMDAVGRGEDWQGELVRHRDDGTKIWESVQVSGLRNAAGEVANFLCLREDITERKRLEEDLRQSQKMESLGTLAGGIAHDFNNLLAVINGYVELSSLHPNDAVLVQKSLREIKRASQRAIGLVRQILTFSRKAEVHFAPLDLNQLARDLVTLLSETFPRKIAFHVALQEGLPALLADQNQIQQVVLNLCVNARDAMPDGGAITVATGVVRGDTLPYAEAQRGQNYAFLQVKDTGTGMSPEVRARIFEPFFTTKQTSEGTGLGLAVVYGIVASHRGIIDVESAVGAGSTFKVYIPLADGCVVAPAASQLSLFPEGTESLLIVDDEDPLRQLLKAAFSRKGYRVISASDGLEAIEIVNDPDRTIDAVLLDLNMPGASGFDVLRAIKAGRPHLPVLVLSGHITPSTRTDLEALGQTEFVAKPYSLDDLGRRLRQLLGDQAAA